MIGHKRIPGSEGGVEVVVEEIATRMVQQGHEVTVYNRKHKDFKNQKTYKGIKIINIPTINKKSLDAVIYSFLASVHALFGHYDVIHYHALGPSVMMCIPKLFRKKVVATVHGLDWQRSKWGEFGTKYLKYGEKTIAKKADVVIVLSKNVQNYFKETYNRETCYVPNGVTRPMIQNAQLIAKKYGLHQDDYILFLARIVPEKGLHYLLDAFRKVETNKKLVIAGGSSHTDSYFSEMMDKAKQDKRVITTGFVQGCEKEELLSNAFLYVLPSDIEGMPISLLEAMSYGIPCLTSDIEENLEVTQNEAMAFKKGNTEDLKNKLQKILRETKKTVNTAWQQKFNWNTCVEKTMQIYQKCCCQPIIKNSEDKKTTSVNRSVK